MVNQKYKSNKTLNFFYLALFSFFYVTLGAFLFDYIKKPIATNPAVLASQAEVAPTPTIQKPKIITPHLINITAPPQLSGEAAIAVDLNSNSVLFEKSPDQIMLPASCAKIMTAIISLENYPLDKVITVKKVGVEGQKMNLISGEQIRVEDLLYGLLVYSANDAAEVLAENFEGGRDIFIQNMNQKAVDLNLTNTYFKNPTGLDGLGQYTSARDLAVLTDYALKNPVFSNIVATKTKVVQSVDQETAHRLENLNKLLGNVEGVLGVKTGWTENARENLVTYIENPDADSSDQSLRKIIIVLLGSQDRFGETKLIINYIFENYFWSEN